MLVHDHLLLRSDMPGFWQTSVVDLQAGTGALIKVGSNVNILLTEQDAKGKKVGEPALVNFIVGLKQVPTGTLGGKYEQDQMA